MELIRKVREDERKVYEKELQLHKENDNRKSKLRTIKDLDSSSGYINSKKYNIDDVMNLSEDEFAKWAKS
jgi:hypothetical protein